MYVMRSQDSGNVSIEKGDWNGKSLVSFFRNFLMKRSRDWTGQRW